MYDLLLPLGLKGLKAYEGIFSEVNIFILLFVKTDLSWSYFHESKAVSVYYRKKSRDVDFSQNLQRRFKEVNKSK